MAGDEQSEPARREWPERLRDIVDLPEHDNFPDAGDLPSVASYARFWVNPTALVPGAWKDLANSEVASLFPDEILAMLATTPQNLLPR